MKKIIISSNSFWNLYNFRYELIYELSKYFKIYLISKKDNYEKKFPKNINIINLDIEKRSTSLVKNFKNLFNYYKVIKKINPEFYLSFTIKPNIYGSIVCSLLKVNYIVNITGLGKLYLYNKIVKNLYILLLKVMLKKAYRIYVHNKADKLIISSNNKNFNKKIVVVPGSGINLNKFKIHKKKKRTFTKYLYIGRILKDKGLHELLDVVEELKKDNYQNTFAFVGSIIDNDLKKKISSLSKKGFLNYLGSSENIIKIISKHDCVILPSYREGLPKSILEAQAMGKPALVSNVPGCNRIIKNNYNGFLFKSKSRKDLKKTILNYDKLTIGDINKLSINARKFIKNFSIERLLDIYLKDLKIKK